MTTKQIQLAQLTWNKTVMEENIDEISLSSENWTSFEHNNNNSWDSTNNTSSSSSYYNNTEFEYFEYPLVFQICIYILYNTVFVSAVVGNILVIYVVLSSVRMRTVTNYLIANLALGDLLMAFLCVPFAYISVLLQYWPFGLVLCHLVSPAQATCVFVSAYTLVALAIDRYMAILYPLRPRLRRSQALIVIALVWIIALFTAVPTALFTRLEVDNARERPLCEESGWGDESWKMGYGYTLLVLQYFFPICVLIYTYTRIGLEIWWKKRPLLDSGSESDGQLSRVVDHCREQRLTKSRRKTVVMTLCVVAGYTLAWLPLNLFGLYMDTLTFEEDEVRLPYLEYIFFPIHWFAMAHTTYNPLIYAWMNLKFRAAFVTVFTNLFGAKRNNKGITGITNTSSNRQQFIDPQGSNLSRIDGSQGVSRILSVETRLIVRDFNPTKRL